MFWDPLGGYSVFLVRHRPLTALTKSPMLDPRRWQEFLKCKLGAGGAEWTRLGMDGLSYVLKCGILIIQYNVCLESPRFTSILFFWVWCHKTHPNKSSWLIKSLETRHVGPIYPAILFCRWWSSRPTWCHPLLYMGRCCTPRDCPIVDGNMNRNYCNYLRNTIYIYINYQCIVWIMYIYIYSW